MNWHAPLLVLAIWLSAAYGSAAGTAPDPQAVPPAPGLSVDDQGRLVRAGQPVRAIGVNYFDAFGRTLHDRDDTSFNAGFATLEELRIPFARFAACGYWPSEMKLYLTDKTEYFRRLDGVVRSAEKHGIGLIPTPLVDVISAHYYGKDPELLKTVAAEAARLRRPLFIGEFGYDGPASPENDKAFEDVLRHVETLEPALAAVWVYDFPEQEKAGWNITLTNAHAARRKLVAEANRRLGRRPEN